MKFHFEIAKKPEAVAEKDWMDWGWQLRHSLKKQSDYELHFDLSESEKAAFQGENSIFKVRTTPYYASLIPKTGDDPIRKIVIPTVRELESDHQALFDPLGERKNNPVSRIIHRYPDRALFLVTDICSVYCRYCTRKHFTGQERAFAKKDEYSEALEYIRSHSGIREVILSGGDPLTLSDSQLEKVLLDLRSIEHIEIIRLGTRMPVVCPMRVTPELTKILRKHAPVFMMTHFNHPRELTAEAANALSLVVDSGIPVMNQMVLLNGVNNHAAIVQALSRRLLYLRVKPYYMFQCDPSIGTDHLRTSVENSLEIQKQLWGVLSGLAMPNLSLDIPDGGGKAAYVPNFEIAKVERVRTYRGFDGVTAEYVSPPETEMRVPVDVHLYQSEWDKTVCAKVSDGKQGVCVVNPLRMDQLCE
ncbi:MAG: KamA family radical SAM protein [Pseudobdellovibrionaceae bacterium]